MHTVIETGSYLTAADEAGLSEAERFDIVTNLAANPMSGNPIRGTGGCRKLRVAGRGKGKSGGYRIVTFYSGVNVPVFLLTVFGKGQKSDLSRAEQNALAKLAATLAESLSK
jgi:hypothetical protein